jgi:hypothetical protein
MENPIYLEYFIDTLFLMIQTSFAKWKKERQQFQLVKGFYIQALYGFEMSQLSKMILFQMGNVSLYVKVVS